MATELFISYAHEDEQLLDSLKSHLHYMLKQGTISVWHDRDITAGSDWKKEIDERLNRADVILLLVSADFIDSDYCYDIEFKRAMERHQAGEARVIPIILRPVRWTATPIGSLQALPKGAKAITKWEDRDEAFVNVAEGIELALKKMASAKTGAPRTSDPVAPESLPTHPLPSNSSLSNPPQIASGDETVAKKKRPPVKTVKDDAGSRRRLKAVPKKTPTPEQLRQKFHQKIGTEVLEILRRQQGVNNLHLHPDIPVELATEARAACGVPTRELVNGLIYHSQWFSVPCYILFGNEGIYFLDRSAKPQAVWYWSLLDKNSIKMSGDTIDLGLDRVLYVPRRSIGIGTMYGIVLNIQEAAERLRTKVVASNKV